jgi:hypothetical protein
LVLLMLMFFLVRMIMFMLMLMILQKPLLNFLCFEICLCLTLNKKHALVICFALFTCFCTCFCSFYIALFNDPI